MLTMICVVVRLRCEKVSDTDGEREGSKERKKEKRDEQHFDEQQPKL